MNIFFDGCSSPHKHNLAGYCVYGDFGLLEWATLDCHTTNNMAELIALKHALDYTRRIFNGSLLTILGDSRLAISGVAGWIHLKNKPLKEMVELIQRDYKKELTNDKIRLKWIPREYNLAGKWIYEHIRGNNV